MVTKVFVPETTSQEIRDLWKIVIGSLKILDLSDKVNIVDISPLKSLDFIYNVNIVDVSPSKKAH